MDVYILYTRKGEEFTVLVKEILSSLEIPFWTDFEMLPTESSPMEAYKNTVRRADVVLALVSQDFIKSDLCMDVFNFAQSIHKKILTVILPNVDIRSVPRNIQNSRLVLTNKLNTLQAFREELSGHVEALNNEMKRPLRVFLCHSSADILKVQAVYDFLKQEGHDPWLDKEKILGGQDWDNEIRKALKVTDIVLVFLSYNSVSKEGYIQKEIKLALDIADEKPEDTIFIIPLRLDNCNVPTCLSRWQWLNLFETDNNKLLLAIEARRKTLGLL